MSYRLLAYSPRGRQEWISSQYHDLESAQSAYDREEDIPDSISAGYDLALRDQDTMQEIARKPIARWTTGRVTFSTSMRRLLEQWEREGCEVSAQLVNGNSVNLEIDFLTMRGGLISYIQRPKTPQFNDDGTWARGGRQEGKPGRVIRRALTTHALNALSDSDIEHFANRVKADSSTDGAVFEIVKGEDIRYWYYYQRYHRDTEDNTLGNSCMRGDSQQKYLDLYVNNPDQVRMLILRDLASNKITGRALVWTCDGGETYMDRVYGGDDIQQAFKEYAIDNGWWSRLWQSYYNMLYLVNPDTGEPEVHSLCVTLTGVDDAPLYSNVTIQDMLGACPYMDTMVWGNKKLNRLSNDHRLAHEYQFQCLGGDYAYDEQDCDIEETMPDPLPCEHPGCRRWLPESTVIDSDGNEHAWCDRHRGQNAAVCVGCSNTLWIHDPRVVLVQRPDYLDRRYCARCASSAQPCHSCAAPTPDRLLRDVVVNGATERVCIYCRDDRNRFGYCGRCGNLVPVAERSASPRYYCAPCEAIRAADETAQAQRLASAATTHAMLIADARAVGLQRRAERVALNAALNTATVPWPDADTDDDNHLPLF
jgi:hypothetical protein